jgi:hypothetical protein
MMLVKRIIIRRHRRCHSRFFYQASAQKRTKVGAVEEKK